MRARMESSIYSFALPISSAQLSFDEYVCGVACAKNKKCLNFASSGSWHLEVGMETPENDFQI